MFRLNAWVEPQDYRPNPFDRAADIGQDVKQVWFAGVHADIGGGYREAESSLSKYPLAWMIEEAAAAGLRVNGAMVNHLVYGEDRAGSTHRYEPPDAKGKLHRSLTLWWAPLEILPKFARWRESRKWSLLGLYLPLAEPRVIPDGAFVHQSAADRKNSKIGYSPVNWPRAPSLVAVNRPSPKRRRPKAARASQTTT